MRLWHKDLIPYLPRQQLLGQWRECCAIAKSIHEKGTPNHVLVNKIMDYPIEHFWFYCGHVQAGMIRRGYKCNEMKCFQHFDETKIKIKDVPDTSDMFENWHNAQYAKQCYYNLQEKHDCGAISDMEWNTFEQGYLKEGYKI